MSKEKEMEAIKSEMDSVFKLMEHYTNLRQKTDKVFSKQLDEFRSQRFELSKKLLNLQCEDFRIAHQEKADRLQKEGWTVEFDTHEHEPCLSLTRPVGNLNIRTMQMIHVNDWNNLVTNVYGKPYSLQQQMDCLDRRLYVKIEVPDKYADRDERCMNDDIPEYLGGHYMGVKFKTWLERDPKKPLAGCEDFGGTDGELFWHRNFYPNLGTLVNDLHAKGHIPAGTYHIEIDR